MPLAPGTRLGPYEVVHLIGAGGMGEVYRATDSRLNRTVAIKILGSQLSGNPEMKQRFDREAQAIAGLTHPNICTLHDVGHHEGLDYLVMECVEGETLAARLERGALPVADAVRIASEVGAALDKAHRQGIVHRDIKPANIMLTKTGAKLLDFGLAKLRSIESPAPMPVTVSAMPADAKNLTMVGSVLGTLQYMAPEQLEGKEADAGTDIFAFGAMLYEMLTGQRAFQGKTQVSLMAAILEHDPPPMSTLQPILPAALDTLVQGCLAKDPDERWQSIRDVVRQLRQIREQPRAENATVSPSSSRSHRRERLAWTAFALLLAGGAAVAAIWLTTPPKVVLSPARFEILPQEGTRWTSPAPRMSISPDGRNLVFAAAGFGSDRTEQFWLRQMDAVTATPVAGTKASAGEVAPQSPFWSPDSRFLGFVVQSEAGGGGFSRVKTVDISGGPVQTICELPSNNVSASWNADGVILVSGQASGGIQRVASSGGTPTPVTKIDEPNGEVAHLWPQFLPDGHHFIYQSQTKARDEWTIHLASLDGTGDTLLVKSEYAQFAMPDVLLFLRGEALMAQTLDLRTFELAGEPVLVARELATVAQNGRVAFAASNTGVLVAMNGRAGVDRHFVWADRAGKTSEPFGPTNGAPTIRLSPDESMVAFAEAGTTATDIWTVDLRRNARVKVTTDPANDQNPVWAGTQILFGSNRAGTGRNDIYEKPSSGASEEKMVLEGGVPLDVSMDGKFLVFFRGTGGKRNLWVLPRTADAKPFPYRTSQFDEGQATVSPDGRWLAYTTNESGTIHVNVQPFPNPAGDKVQVSTDGGQSPRWRRDGRELYYVDPVGRLMAVSVSMNPRLTVQRPVELFTIPFGLSGAGGSAFSYDAAGDGQRFLMSMPIGRIGTLQAPLTVTLNWNAALAK